MDKPRCKSVGPFVYQSDNKLFGN